MWSCARWLPRQSYLKFKLKFKNSNLNFVSVRSIVRISNFKNKKFQFKFWILKFWILKFWNLNSEIQISNIWNSNLKNSNLKFKLKFQIWNSNWNLFPYDQSYEFQIWISNLNSEILNSRDFKERTAPFKTAVIWWFGRFPAEIEDCHQTKYDFRSNRCSF